MTEKHYILIARAIKNTKESKIAETKNEGLAFLLGQLTEIFKNDDPNFDKNKFLKACNFEHIEHTE